MEQPKLEIKIRESMAYREYLQKLSKMTKVVSINREDQDRWEFTQVKK